VFQREKKRRKRRKTKERRKKDERKKRKDKDHLRISFLNVLKYFKIF